MTAVLLGRVANTVAASSQLSSPIEAELSPQMTYPSLEIVQPYAKTREFCLLQTLDLSQNAR
jgi:hypothetical protein